MPAGFLGRMGIVFSTVRAAGTSRSSPWPHSSFRAPESGPLALSAVPAESRPGHHVQPGSSDRLAARLTDAERSRPYPAERIFNLSEHLAIGLAKSQLKVRFDIGAGDVHNIPFDAAGGRQRHPTRLQLVALGEQQRRIAFQFLGLRHLLPSSSHTLSLPSPAAPRRFPAQLLAFGSLPDFSSNPIPPNSQ